jgi:3-oxoadipate enol-lactonase
MNFIRVNGVSLHFEATGLGRDLPTIVFSNSLGTDLRIWDDVARKLASDFSIITYDKRGHGLSDLGEIPYTIDTHVDDLVGLLEYLGASQSIICGLSVGGLIAQGLYASQPDLVRALVLCDTASKIGDNTMWNKRISAIKQGGIESIADDILSRWFTPGFRRDTNPLYAGSRNMLVRQSTSGYIATCSAIRDSDLTTAARKITVPTLCIVGEADGSTPPDLVAALAQSIPNARYEVISDSGHIPCIEQPEALAVLIRKFVQALPVGES